jgi:hypothetical protein
VILIFEKETISLKTTSKQQPTRHVYGAVNMSNRPLSHPPRAPSRRPPASRVPQGRTPPFRTKQAEPPLLSLPFILPPPLVSFSRRTEPGWLRLLLVAGAGAGRPGLATKGEHLLLLIVSMVPSISSSISSIRLFFAVLPQLR